MICLASSSHKQWYGRSHGAATVLRAVYHHSGLESGQIRACRQSRRRARAVEEMRQKRSGGGGQGGGSLQPGSGKGISLSVVGSATSTRFSTRSAFAVAEKPIVVAKSTKDRHNIFFIGIDLPSFESHVTNSRRVKIT
jgi:hypothetical protein